MLILISKFEHSDMLLVFPLALPSPSLERLKKCPPGAKQSHELVAETATLVGEHDAEVGMELCIALGNG